MKKIYKWLITLCSGFFYIMALEKGLTDIGVFSFLVGYSLSHLRMSIEIKEIIKEMKK